ncbi:MAG: hypothetical protein H6626_13635 [Pseudobdellovibrionaceae bacterium]|nr:hypothetical protein [Bdellovibrionales bacterium]USN47211.1 MAG: hypothetical protein H6626_13635 [Pseudobdellovibrionaceae bacterium]
MSLSERSYNTQIYRPKPEIHHESDGQLTVIATPWGPRAAAKKASQVIVDQFLSSREDRESTSPFARLTCLSSFANDLRASVYLANDTLYNEDNKSEYSAGVELLAIAKVENEVTLVQSGHPMVLLQRADQPLCLLGSQVDFAAQFSTHKKPMPPLPGQLLGLSSTSNLFIHSLRYQPGDKLILVSQSFLPGSLFSLKSDQFNLDDMANHLIQTQPDHPFWLGLLEY